MTQPLHLRFTRPSVLAVWIYNCHQISPPHKRRHSATTA